MELGKLSTGLNRVVEVEKANVGMERSEMETQRRLVSLQLSVLLLVGVAAGAQVDSLNQNGQAAGGARTGSTTAPGGGQTAATQDMLTPGITVNGSTPAATQDLPKLPPDKFTDCYATHNTSGPDSLDYIAMTICEAQLEADRRVVIDKCINRDGKAAPPVVIQACTELLDQKIFIGSDRFYIYVNRAEAYVAQGDRPHALDDYNEAVKLAPHNAKLYFNRAVFYLAQPDTDAAMRDLDTALRLNPKLVPALLQRAKLHKTRADLGGALADYSEALRLEPKTAAVWSEAGYVCLLQHDYESAIKDEAEAIRLDPKLARAYFFRGAAFGGLGDSSKARSDIVAAVRLDPSLQRFVSGNSQNPLGEH